MRTCQILSACTLQGQGVGLFCFCLIFIVRGSVVVLVVSIASPRSVCFVYFRRVRGLLRLFFIGVRVPRGITSLLVLRGIPFLFSRFRRAFRFFSRLYLYFFHFRYYVLFFFLYRIISSSRIAFCFIPGR